MMNWIAGTQRNSKDGGLICCFLTSAKLGGGNLPQELEGRDLTPDTLEKINGEDQTAMQRVIITYYQKDEQFVANLLGVEAIEKVVYNVDELKK